MLYYLRKPAWLPFLTPLFKLVFRAEALGEVREEVQIWDHKIHQPRPVLLPHEKGIRALRRWYAQFYPGRGEALVEGAGEGLGGGSVEGLCGVPAGSSESGEDLVEGLVGSAADSTVEGPAGHAAEGTVGSSADSTVGGPAEGTVGGQHASLGIGPVRRG
jgi:hypothetical protein